MAALPAANPNFQFSTSFTPPCLSNIYFLAFLIFLHFSHCILFLPSLSTSPIVFLLLPSSLYSPVTINLSRVLYLIPVFLSLLRSLFSCPYLRSHFAFPVLIYIPEIFHHFCILLLDSFSSSKALRILSHFHISISLHIQYFCESI